MALRHPLLLLLVPVALVVVAWSLKGRGYGRFRLAFVALLRTTLALAAILAAAGSSMLLPSPHRTVVVLVDGSPSCTHRPTDLGTLGQDVVEQVERVTDADPSATLLFYRFDDRPRPVEDPENLRLVPGERSDATNIARALETAGAAIPERHSGFVMLFSDGIQTQGDAAASARALGRRSVPVYVFPSAQGFAADVRVAELKAPETVSPGRPFVVTCRVESTRSLEADFTLTRDGEPVTSRKVKVAPGAPAVIETVETLKDEGLHVYAANASFREDRLRFNNELRVPVRVGTRPLIVYLSGFEGETPVEKLAGKLEGFRFRRLAEGDELTPEVLAEASVIVLDNFPAERLGRGTRRVAHYVRDTGGGLVMIGGPGSFGAGGYIDTEIDRVLPVHCDPRDADKTPLALVVCLDASGSMGEGDGLKIRMARAAALQTLSRLTPKDVASVIAFRVTPEVIVALGPVENVDAVGRKLTGVSPVGGTNIFPALERALSELDGNPSPLRHVVLLSDGRSQPGDVTGIVARFKKAKVSLSTLATGAATDRALLERLATETGGRFYEAVDIRRLPDFFLDDLRRIEGPLVRKGDFRLGVTERDELLKGLDVSSPPRIKAYNRTRLREGAVEHLSHVFEGDPEPVLATGRAGLGRSAALTLSFDTEWIGGFGAWPHASDVIVRVFRRVARSERAKEVSLIVRRDGERFHLEARDERATPPTDVPMTLSVALGALGGKTVEVRLRRTAARRYEGEAQMDVSRLVTVATLIGRIGDVSEILDVRYVPGSYSREYRSFAPRLDVLRSIARLSGGRIITTDAELLDAAKPPGRERRDLTLWLVALALALFMTELVGRAFGWL